MSSQNRLLFMLCLFLFLQVQYVTFTCNLHTLTIILFNGIAVSISTIYVALGSEVLQRWLLLLQLNTIAKVVVQIMESRYFFVKAHTHMNNCVMLWGNGIFLQFSISKSPNKTRSWSTAVVLCTTLGKDIIMPVTTLCYSGTNSKPLTLGFLPHPYPSSWLPMSICFGQCILQTIKTTAVQSHLVWCNNSLLLCSVSCTDPKLRLRLCKN